MMNVTEQEVWEYLENRFGVDRSRLNGLELVEQSGDYWIVAGQGAVQSGIAVETRGFRFVRVQDIGLKPTTYALQFLDDMITRNRVDLSEDELVAVLSGEIVPCDVVEAGYVALVYRETVVGCGFAKDGTVSSRIPKGRAQELRQALTVET